MRQRITINWSVSSYFGWGVYGLNLALQWANDPDIELMSCIPIAPDDLYIDPIQRRALAPFLGVSKALEKILPPLGTRIQLECPVLSDVYLGPERFEYSISGSPTIGLVFFDTTQLTQDALSRARAVPVIVTESEWNTRILNYHGLDNVVTILQGIEPALFHPAPASRWLGDRFCVFSGGKLEHRKAQDIVLAAFRMFAKRHREALLVTTWHSPWPDLVRTLDGSALVSPIRLTDSGRADVVGWAIENGIDADQILDLGVVPNREMPSVLREMDVAVFPNRCEPGTNLVAMECMASGLPVILSRNTGHLDLIEAENCYPLDHQADMEGYAAGIGTVPGWGESRVEEIVEHLERIFTDRAAAQRRGHRAAEIMAQLTWKRTAERLKGVVLEHAMRSR